VGTGLPAALKRWGWAVLLVLGGLGGWGRWTRLWTRYTWVDGELRPQRTLVCESAPPEPCPAAAYPADWDIRQAVWADVTGDGAPECVLLVWRPWRDWPIMRWKKGESPIASFRDAQGDSAHVIITRPGQNGTYRELWAGSALPVPLMALVAGDVDADGIAELVGLETDYDRGRTGPGRRVSLWAWDGFGFELETRSPAGHFTALYLTPPGEKGQQAICVRGYPAGWGQE